jgi:hypothetical protein
LPHFCVAGERAENSINHCTLAQITKKLSHYWLFGQNLRIHQAIDRDACCTTIRTVQKISEVEKKLHEFTVKVHIPKFIFLNVQKKFLFMC